MNPVLCVRNDPDDTLGITPLAFESLRLPVECFDAFSTDVRWPGVEEISALVIFGGEMKADAHEKLLEIFGWPAPTVSRQPT